MTHTGADWENKHINIIGNRSFQDYNFAFRGSAPTKGECDGVRGDFRSCDNSACGWENVPSL